MDNTLLLCLLTFDFAASRGSVKDLIALIASRTVHMPTAKNNTGGAILSEALDACAATAASLCPPVAPHDETGVNVDANGVNGDGANSVNGDGVHGYDVDDDGEGARSLYGDSSFDQCNHRDLCWCVGDSLLPGGVREGYCLLLYQNSSGRPTN
jgi:hypothetical protein